MSKTKARNRRRALADFEQKVAAIDRQAADDYERRMVKAYIELGEELEPGSHDVSAFSAGIKARHGSVYGVVGGSYFDGRRSMRGGSTS